MHLLNQIFAVTLLATVLSACGTSNPYTTQHTAVEGAATATNGVQTQAVPATDTSTSQPLPVTQPKTLGPATRSLVAQAQQQLKAGQDAAAASTLERALRIEPDNPLIWLEMAKLRHTEGNAAQAESMARKALSMAGGDARVQSSAWRVIADSFRARGRNPEAREADARAAALSGS
jgi:predicted Zn-dependent protease